MLGQKKLICSLSSLPASLKDYQFHDGQFHDGYFTLMLGRFLNDYE